jgi:hypothetical protein
MGTVREIDLSETTDGASIGISATSSPGQDIHTSTDEEGGYDKIQLYAVNLAAVDRRLTLALGSNFTSALVPVTLAPNVGLVLVLPLTRMSGGRVLSAWTDGAGNEVNVSGWVLRSRRYL